MASEGDRGAGRGGGKPDLEMLSRFEQVFSDWVPHNKALGLSVLDAGSGFAVMRLPYSENLVGNPQTGVLHGGAITSVIDACCGAAVFLKLQSAHRIATLDLRIDYLRPATPGQDVLARAECYKVTKSVAFVRAYAFHHPGDVAPPAELPSELLVAAASGTFMLFTDSFSTIGRALERE